MIEIENLSFGYRNHNVLKELNFKVSAGEFISIIGPNGTGKSTLLRLISGYIKPSGGNIMLMGKDINTFNNLELARKRAFVTQENVINFPYTVREMVMMARYPFLGTFQNESKGDYDIVEDALKKTGTLHLALRLLTELSGGERQRVMIAKALAQKSELLLLDEPTSSLDINYQIDILDHIKLLNREEGVTVILILHDLNLAAQYSNRLILLNKGSVHSMGSPEEVLTEENIEQVFSLKVNIEKDAKGRPRLFPLSKVV